MGSPITKWEGAAEYFTYANNPTVMYTILGLSVAVTFLAIVKGWRHENEAYHKLKKQQL